VSKSEAPREEAQPEDVEPQQEIVEAAPVERPYLDAITPEHRAVLEEAGQLPQEE